MLKIKEECIFYANHKSYSLPEHFCMIEGRYIQSCPQDCSYYLNKVRTIAQLAFELKYKSSSKAKGAASNVND